MFKLDRKLIISATVSALFTASGIAGTASDTYSNGKKVIDGGVTYPVVDSKRGNYVISPQKESYMHGRLATKNELKAWNTDVMPDGTGLPKGSGSVEEGEEIYEEKCVMCHGDFGSGGGGYPSLSKGNAQEAHATLKNQRNVPNADGPVRVFGSYWPHLSTMWWYIHDGMPHPKTKSLSSDETYALTAYMLNINELTIDGEEIDDEFVLSHDNFLKIKMPNVDGFEPKIDGPNGTDNVRKYFANNKNFGAQKVNPADRCMKNCQKKSAKIVRIKGVGISDFLPPISVKRDLPESANAPVVGQAAYEASCAVCHGTSSMGAPEVGDKDAWEAVMIKGITTVYSNAMNGVGGMPPKGGNMDLEDAEIKEIVDYMYSLSR